MTMTIKNSIKSQLWEYFDTCGSRLITGWELYRAMADRTGRHTYPETLLQYVREYADVSGAEFVCMDRVKSLYRFKPGAKIAGAIIDRRE